MTSTIADRGKWNALCSTYRRTIAAAGEKISTPIGGPRRAVPGMVRLYTVLIAPRQSALRVTAGLRPRREDCNRPRRRGDESGRDAIRRRDGRHPGSLPGRKGGVDGNYRRRD